MHSFTRAVTGIFLAISASTALADNNQDGYWYLGAGFGTARHQADNLGTLLGTAPSVADTRSTSGKLFTGYRWNSFFGMEIGYIDFGRISGQGAQPAPGDTSPPPTDSGSTPTGSGDSSGSGTDTSGSTSSSDGSSASTDPTTGTPAVISTPSAVSSNRVLRRTAVDPGMQSVNVVTHSKGIQLAGVGYLPVNDYFDLFGKFGTFTSITHASLSAPDASSSDSKISTDLTWGLGAQVYFNNFLSARLEWEHFRNIGKGVMGAAPGVPVDLTSMSVIWNF